MFGVGYFLTRDATVYPDRIAIYSEGKEFTYRELNTRTNILANNLIKIGIKKGDRVAYLFRNCVEAVEILFATQKIGAVAVPLNFRAYSDEIEYCITFAECNVLIYDEQFKTLIQRIKLNLTSVKTFICNSPQVPEGELAYASLVESGCAAEPMVHIDNDKDWSRILYTSGTTGRPKGVIHTHRGVRDNALMLISGDDNLVHECMVTHCPLFHTSGQQLLTKIIAGGGTFVIIDKFDPDYLLGLIDKYKATQVLLLPPVIYMRLSEAKNLANYDLSSVREAQASGGGFSYTYVQKIFELFPNCKIIRYSWGMTEIGSGIGWGFSKEELAADHDLMQSVGKVCPLTEVRLVDENGNDVPDGEVGEGIVRGTCVTEGYLNLPDVTAATIKDGWLYSGDLFVKKPNGFYYMVDRAKDMVKQGGENVFAQEVERVLLSHTQIIDAAVIGVPDERWGEAVAAAIVPKLGSNLSIEEPNAFCRENMPGYKCPYYYLFMDALPVNSIGKIQKHELRKIADQFTRLPGKEK